MIFFKGKITIESLVKYMNGSMGEEERHEIIRWIESCQDNQDFFNRLRNIWEKQEDLSSLLQENRQSDWEKVIMQLEKLPETKAGKIKIRSLWWQRIAAALLLFVFSTLGYFAGKNNHVPLFTGNSVYHEIIVPLGEKSELKLSDGSIIWVNAGSKLRFPNAFNNISRDIWLDGEAYFEVAHDKRRPFLVHTSEVDVKVYGTKFNLKAYNEDDIFEATLIEGLVSLETKNFLNNKPEEIFLEPHRKAIYLKKKTKNIGNDIVLSVQEPLKPRKIIISNPVKTESSISWREGKLEFFDETFENIAVKLERRYGVDIQSDDKEMESIRYSGVLKNISIEQALKAIQMTANFEFEINDNIVIINTNDRKKVKNSR